MIFVHYYKLLIQKMKVLIFEAEKDYIDINLYTHRELHSTAQ